jgi:cell division inhibitor SepF
MAGGMRKVAVMLGLVEDDAQYSGTYEADYPSYDAYEPEPAARPRATVPAASAGVAAATTGAAARSLHAVSVEHSAPAAPAFGAGDLTRITTLHPRTYNDARAVGEAFRDGSPVIMNLTDMDDSDAKRLVDFSAGLVFGLRGTIERVTAKVFLLSPSDVTVTAEDKARIAQGGFFNQS